MTWCDVSHSQAKLDNNGDHIKMSFGHGADKKNVGAPPQRPPPPHLSSRTALRRPSYSGGKLTLEAARLSREGAEDAPPLPKRAAMPVVPVSMYLHTWSRNPPSCLPESVLPDPPFGNTWPSFSPSSIPPCAGQDRQGLGLPQRHPQPHGRRLRLSIFPGRPCLEKGLFTQCV